VGVPAALAAVISLSIVSVVLLAWYSVRQAARSGGRTWVEMRAAGILHFKFGTEINPSLGDRSAIDQDPVAPEQSSVAIESPPTETTSRRRRWPWLRRRQPPDGGEVT